MELVGRRTDRMLGMSEAEHILEVETTEHTLSLASLGVTSA